MNHHPIVVDTITIYPCSTSCLLLSDFHPSIHPSIIRLPCLITIRNNKNDYFSPCLNQAPLLFFSPATEARHFQRLTFFPPKKREKEKTASSYTRPVRQRQTHRHKIPFLSHIVLFPFSLYFISNTPTLFKLWWLASASASSCATKGLSRTSSAPFLGMIDALIAVLGIQVCLLY